MISTTPVLWVTRQKVCAGGRIRLQAQERTWQIAFHCNSLECLHPCHLKAMATANVLRHMLRFQAQWQCQNTPPQNNTPKHRWLTWDIPQNKRSLEGVVSLPLPFASSSNSDFSQDYPVYNHIQSRSEVPSFYYEKFFISTQALAVEFFTFHPCFCSTCIREDHKNWGKKRDVCGA